MKSIHHLITLAVALATAQLASSAVPSAINYQGRLTNSAGVPQPGNRTMNLKVYDAATGGRAAAGIDRGGRERGD